jgi:glycosyltransferase involved in cell wall biosynthesis
MITKSNELIFVITSLNRGGAEEVVRQKLIYFLERNYIVRLFVLKDLEKEIIIEQHHNLIIHRIGATNSPLIILKAIWRILLLLKKYNNTSIIFSHMIHANLIMLLLKYFGLKNRLICVAHNTKEGGGILEKCYSHLSKFSNHFIQVSEEGKQIYLRKGFCRTNLGVIFNGIDTKTLPNREGSFDPNGKIRFVWVGRFVEQKNPLLALRMFEVLKHERIDFHATMYGEGPLLSNAQEFIQQNNLNENITLQGYCSDKETIYNDKDIFLMTSEYEGFGLALAEALYSSLICFCCECDGIRDLGAAHSFYLSKDPKSLYNNVQLLKRKEKSEINRRIKESKATINREYTLKRMCGQYEQLLND